jgi:hypothetical protein
MYYVLKDQKLSAYVFLDYTGIARILTYKKHIIRLIKVRVGIRLGSAIIADLLIGVKIDIRLNLI